MSVQQLFGNSKSDAVVAHVKDGVIGSDEDIAENSQRADVRWVNRYP